MSTVIWFVSKKKNHSNSCFFGWFTFCKHHIAVKYLQFKVITFSYFLNLIEHLNCNISAYNFKCILHLITAQFYIVHLYSLPHCVVYSDENPPFLRLIFLILLCRVVWGSVKAGSRKASYLQCASIMYY